MDRLEGSFLGDLKAPIFCPTEEEFEDPINYIHQIFKYASNYGICKIRPPPFWSPPFAVSDTTFKFTPRVQKLSDVSADNRIRKDFISSLVNFWQLRNVVLFTQHVKGKQVDLFKLWRAVESAGGYNNVCCNKGWPDICKKLNFDTSSGVASTISEKYQKVLLPFELFVNSKHLIEENILTCRKCHKSGSPDSLLVCNDCNFDGIYHTFCLDAPLSHNPQNDWFCPKCFSKRFREANQLDEFGFQKSPRSYKLRAFGDFADNFKTTYFGRPIETIGISDVREEFWRLISDVESDVTVEYGADLCSSEVGSGFPTKLSPSASHFYVSSPWNLNNFASNELSALKYLPADISGMKVPWCYVGMVFSCFCWHTEDHWSFSINYLHRGEPKTWYGVPGDSAEAFESVVRAGAPELFERSPDLLHHMTTMVPPEHLGRCGVPVYHVDQLAGEFVVTFPRAYHAGFNCGFNFAEAVNFCPAEWFPMGRDCVDHYALLHRPPVFSHSELLCRLAGGFAPNSFRRIEFLAVVAGQLADLLSKERCLRRHLALLGVRRTERLMFESREEESRECQLCKTILFVSALSCACGKTMLCLEHYQSCTCCSVEDRVLLYRHGLDELAQFVEKPQARLRDYEAWVARVDKLLHWDPSTDLSVHQNHIKVEGSGELKTDNLIEENCESENVEDEKPVSVSATKFKDEDLSSAKITQKELYDLWEKGRRCGYPRYSVRRLGKIVETATQCASVISSLTAPFTEPEENEDDFDAGIEELDDERNALALPDSRSTPRKHIKESKQLGTPKKDPNELPSGPIVTKLTLAEFICFVKVVSELPCQIEEATDLSAFKQKMAKWRATVSQLLESVCQPVDPKEAASDGARCQLPSVATVEELVQYANHVKVELKELRKLKQLLECVTWLESADRVLMHHHPTKTMEAEDYEEEREEDTITLNELIDLQARGDVLVTPNNDPCRPPPTSSEETVRTRLEAAISQRSNSLLDIIAEAQLLERAIKNVIASPNGSCVIEEAEVLVLQTAGLKATFESADELARLCERGHAILAHLDSFKRLLRCPKPRDPVLRSTTVSDDEGLELEPLPDEFAKRIKLNSVESTPRVWLNFYEELRAGANKLPFVFHDTEMIGNLLTVLDRCFTRIKEVFLHTDGSDSLTSSSSAAHLLEILLPRPKAALGHLIQRDTGLAAGTNSASSGGGGSTNPASNLDLRAYHASCGENAKRFLEELRGGGDFDHMYDTFYTPMIETELKLLHYLRRSNIHKGKEHNQDSVVYCICRQPGYSGLMLQCELCKDWFHAKCIGFSGKNVDLSRLCYTCPRCERSQRPELSVVIPILEELIPFVTGGGKQPASLSPSTGCASTTLASGGPVPTKSSITSSLIAPLVSVEFLLRLPSLAAVQMLCERAFAFVRRVRTVILSTPDLRRALTEYEAFSGIQMPFNSFSDDIDTRIPTAISSSTGNQPSPLSSILHKPTTFSRHRLPPNVARPPGMQPLVLRTTAPRAMTGGTHSHHHFGRGLPTTYGSIKPVPATHRREQKTPPDDLDESGPEEETSMHHPGSPSASSFPRSGHAHEAEAAVALAFMSSTTDAPASSVNGILGQQSRIRIDASHQEPSATDAASPPPPAYFRYYLPSEARNCLDTLITEACALEVSLPQTRWLWQLALAADPDCAGALHPRLALAGELQHRQNISRQQHLRRQHHMRPSQGQAAEQFGDAGNGGARSRRRKRSSSSNAGAAASHGQMRISTGQPTYYAKVVKRGRQAANDQEVRTPSESRTLELEPQRHIFQHHQHHVQQYHRWSTKRRYLPPLIAHRRGGEIVSRRARHFQLSSSNSHPPHRRRLPATGCRRLPSSRALGIGPSWTETTKRVRGDFEVYRVSDDYDVYGRHNRDDDIESDNAEMDDEERRSDDMILEVPARRHSALVAMRKRRSPNFVHPTSRAPIRRPVRRAVPSGEVKEEVDAVTTTAVELVDDERCEAPAGCRTPRGTVEWVACDRCNTWYHQVCVGIMSAREVPEVYVCVTCRKDIRRKDSSEPDQPFPPSLQDVEVHRNHGRFIQETRASSTCDFSPPTIDSGRATSNKFRPGESTGADALLQAIAVLEAQPVTAVEEVENVADDVDTLGENRHVEIAVKSHHADSEKDSFPYETP